MEEFCCPGCQSRLSPRQLLTNTTITERCPRCSTVIREGDGFRYTDTERITAEEVAAVGGWMESECSEAGCVCEQDRGREQQREYVWRVSAGVLSDCPANWSLDVVYAADMPGAFAVRLTATEEGVLPEEFTPALPRVLRDHALQPHGGTDAAGSFLTGESAVRLTWGATRLLTVPYQFSEGLFRPVVAQLLRAMRDADTTRQRFRG